MDVPRGTFLWSGAKCDYCVSWGRHLGGCFCVLVVAGCRVVSLDVVFGVAECRFFEVGLKFGYYGFTDIIFCDNGEPDIGLSNIGKSYIG